MICSWFLASIFCFQQPCQIIQPIIYDKKATFTAYTLSEDETDSTPCIGAGNHDLCAIRASEPDKCIIATRSLNLHRRILTKEFGECEVLDRTAAKYGERFDILLTTKEEAKKFGVKEISYKLLP